MAAGENPPSLSFHFRAGVTTIREIVSETCKAIWRILQPQVMPKPDELKWKQIASEFYGRFQFPLCLGAIDGKHIRIKKPNKSGSKYYNYKGYFSILLLAVTDADGKFIAVDIGSCGGNSDAGVFNRSSFGRRLRANKLGIPKPDVIPGSDIEVPYVFVADDAFPLETNIMKPFSQRQLTHEKELFNYRLSRARNSVECGFGKLATMWRILLRQMDVQPTAASDIVKAITVLHNFVIIHEPVRGPTTASQQETSFEMQAPEFANLQRQRNRSTTQALHVRETLMNFFLSDRGRLPWQDAMCYN